MVRHQEITAPIGRCDGFHGVRRKTIPARKRTEIRTGLPSFGCWGFLSRTKPVNDEYDLCQPPKHASALGLYAQGKSERVITSGGLSRERRRRER